MATRKRLTDNERGVWTAAYAAAFVADFGDATQRVGWDQATELASAEEPALIANLAVLRLRQWRKSEPHCGRLL